MKYRKKWYEYKQPKRRMDAFCEQNNIPTIKVNVDEVLENIKENYFCENHFVLESWDEFVKNAPK